MTAPQPAIQYKSKYNEGRELAEPRWGRKLSLVKCPTCGSREMYASAHPDNPEEIISSEMVRCGSCGHITDWYEAHKQLRFHAGDTPREIEGGP